MVYKTDQITLDPGEPEDPINLINVAQFQDGKIIESYTEELSDDAFSSEPFEEKDAENGGDPGPSSKLARSEPARRPSRPADPEPIPTPPSRPR